MRTVTVAFILATLSAAVLTPLVRALARRLGVLDHALTSRKIHGLPIPRLGGVAIVAAFFVPVVALFFADSSVGHIFYSEGRRALGLIIGGLAIALLGVYDDLRGAGAPRKFLVQFAVAAAMYHLGYRVDEIANPFGDPIALGWLGLPFTLLWIVGVVNAMNLIDGLDGLAGGVALIAVATTFLVAFQRGEPLMMLSTAALAGAVLGFLFYNFNPASIFMGDAGSMFLGFVLAASAIRTHQKSSTAVAMLIPVVVLGLPIGDTLLSIVRRAVRGAPLFHSDRGHIHHRLLAAGLSQRQVVLVLYAICVMLGGVAIAMTRATSGQTVLFLGGIGVVAFALLSFAGYIRFGVAREVMGDRRRNLEMRGAVREIGESLRDAAGLDEVWELVKRAARPLGASCVELTLAESRGSERAVAVRTLGFDEAGSAVLRARYSLLGERPDDGAIELGWDDGRATVDRDTEIAVELLCEHVLGAVRRIEGARGDEEGGGAEVVILRRPR